MKIVFDYGGIYLDTDVELLKSLDHLLDNKCYIGIQQAQSLCQTGLGFGAEKKSYIVEKMLEKYSNIEFDVNKKLELNILIRMVVKICCVRIQFQYIIIVQVGLVEDNGLRDV